MIPYTVTELWAEAPRGKAMTLAQPSTQAIFMSVISEDW
jgi:hypothetical protein